MKYKLTENTKKTGNITLFQIQSISSGILGGWIEKEENLSQEGDCWIFENAEVYENTRIYGNAKIFGFTKVSGNAKVFGNAQIFGNAIVSGNVKVWGKTQVFGNAQISGFSEVWDNARISGSARVSGKARVCRNAKVSGFAQISDSAQVFGNTKVFGDAQIFGNTKVFGDAQVFGNAKVFGDAEVFGNVEISGDTRIKYSCNSSNSSNLVSIIKGSLNIFPDERGNYILYKRVNKTGNKYFSCYDPSFEYKIGEIVKVEKPDLSNKSCASGIHLSHPDYWNKGNVLLQCEVNISDIITCQEGKVRCKKCKVIGEVK